MQPTGREMQGMASRTLSPSSQISLQELQQQQMTNPAQIPVQNSSHFDHHQSTQDDFFDQILSTLPASWADLSGNPKSPWDLNPQNPNNNPSSTATNSNNNEQKLFKAGEDQQQYPYDESTLLASRLRQNQISGNSPKSMMLQQQLLLSRGGGAPTSASGITAFSAADPVFFPLRLGNSDASDSHLHEGTVQGLFNSLTGSLPSPRNAQTVNQQHFHHPQTPNFGATINGMTQVAVAGTSGGGGTVTAPVRQKVRARRGQATDPHSIAERLRRERIAERMKALQELVPNANKTDKASMLDEIIDYVKFLQLQVKVLSMSRLGGAGAVAPLVADISAEGGGGDCIEGGGGANNGTNGAPGNDNSLTVTEHQVAKLMEEDMGSAMQYLQGKGLCLMPISLASAISIATACHSRNPGHPFDGPTSPNLSALTVQSATLANGNVEAPVKDPKS